MNYLLGIDNPHVTKIDELPQLYTNKLDEFNCLEKKPIIIKNILRQETCQSIINSAERLASKNLSNNKFINNLGWTSHRHNNYPTTDIPLVDLPVWKDLFNRFVINQIFPHLESYTNIDKSLFHIKDIFVVKYHYKRQNYLPIHKDGSEFSFNILLNSESEFEGGGTKFFTVNNNYELYKLNQGDMLIHSGKVKHSGNPITSGVRYIIVGFISLLRKNQLSLYSNKNLNQKTFLYDFTFKEIDNINLKSFSINTEKDDDILDYYEKEIDYLKKYNRKSCNLNISSLNLSNENMDVIEKLVYELYIFHMNRLDLIDNINDYTVEFWSNINILTPSAPKFLKLTHTDKCEDYHSKTDILYSPILSTVTYIDKTITPTLIMNTKAYSEFDSKRVGNIKFNLFNGFEMSFPNNLKHIAFNGNCYHNVLNLERPSENNLSQLDCIYEKYRISLCFNIFKKNKCYKIKPLYKHDELNISFAKNQFYFEIKEYFEKQELYLSNREMYEILTKIMSNDVDYKLIDKLNEMCDNHDLYDVYQFKCV
jgi:hypothetical protein